MKAKLICYDMSNLDQYRKVLVNRALFGYNDHSNKGNYLYKRGGILKEVPHLKLLRGILIVEQKQEKKIVNVLEKYKAKYHIFIVEISKSMLH